MLVVLLLLGLQINFGNLLTDLLFDFLRHVRVDVLRKMILAVEPLAALVAAMHLISAMNDRVSLQVLLQSKRVHKLCFGSLLDDKLTARLNVLLHTVQMCGRSVM